MAMTYFYEELPLNQVIAAEKLIESKIHKEELRLACECATQCTAWTELNGKNGVKLFVARATDYDNEIQDYRYKVQLLDEDLNVIEQVVYRKAIKGDFGDGLSEYVRYDDGYCVEPLMHIAATVIRRTR